MKNLLSLLEKISNTLNRDVIVKENIAKAIEGRTRARISLEKINLKDGILEIEATSAVKNEIFLKESALKEELKERFKIPVTRIIYK